MKTDKIKILLSVLFVFFARSISFSQNQTDIITADYFGFDFWGINKSFWVSVYEQMAEDSLRFDLVGTDAVNWQRLEPEPPIKGVHTYNWGLLDTLGWYTQQAGKKLDLGIRPASNWGTVYPADSLEVCCGMSPILPDSLCDTLSWGMTAKQAWKELIYNLVERYDGDITGRPTLPIDKSLIKTLMIGNEPEAPGHFFASQKVDPGGNVKALNEIFELTYDTAKYANPDIIIVRGKSNPGYIFDDSPGLTEVYGRRKDFFDSLNADFSFGAKYYDIFAINYNDHYTSLEGYTQWLQENMQINGIDKPLLVGDARTTLSPRDNNYPDSTQLLPSVYPPDFYISLDDTANGDYLANKKLYQSDKVMQSIKKILTALGTNQFQISMQPVYTSMELDSSLQQNRRNMWLYSGFFDPYIYETTNSLAHAREPLYWALKQLTNVLIGARKPLTALSLGNYIYAYEIENPTLGKHIIIWHENNKATDPISGLRARNQNINIDLSSVISTPYTVIQFFSNDVNDFGEAILLNDTLVNTTSVPISEMPIILSPEIINGAQGTKSNNSIHIYPNPTTNFFYLTLYEVPQPQDIISIKNSMGTILYTSKIDQIETKVDLSNFANGLYVIEIQIGNNKLYKRIIKI